MEQACTLGYFRDQRSLPGLDCAYLYSSLSSEYHRHMDFYEFSLVTRGSFVNIYNDQRQTLPKNALLYFRCGEAHSILTDTDSDTHLTFIVKKDRFEQYCKQYFPESDFFFTHGCSIRQLSQLHGEYLADLFKSVYVSSPGEELNNYIEIFLFNVMAMIQTSSVTSHPERSVDRYVDKLLTNLNNYYYQEFPVSRIYEEFPIAQSTLINNFRRRTGYTIVQYLGIKKMERAAILLQETELSLEDVASTVGIRSLSHFVHKFREHHGMTPKEYKRICQLDAAAGYLAGRNPNYHPKKQ